MGKKGKKAQTGKPKKLTPKEIGKRLDALVKKLEEELKGADLFAPPPPTEDCPICLVPLNRTAEHSWYLTCCGKTICHGCAGEYRRLVVPSPCKCPFCRAEAPGDKELMKRLEARSLQGDIESCCYLGTVFSEGRHGVQKNVLKGLDYWIRATELGSLEACQNIAHCYRGSECLSIDMARSALFDRVGAVRGNIFCRSNIGNTEYRSGNHKLGIRHWKLAAHGGNQLALENLKKIYNAKLPGKEHISKGELDNLSRTCHCAQEEVTSEEREKHKMRGEQEEESKRTYVTFEAR